MENILIEKKKELEEFKKELKELREEYFSGISCVNEEALISSIREIEEEIEELEEDIKALENS